MAPVLVIVESPAKCGKIEQYLGNGYKCLASFGHIREIANLKAIHPTHVEFVISKDKEKQVAKLRMAAKQASAVYLASDDDREGEAIAWHVCVTLGLDPATTSRMVFHEITKPAVQQAVQNLRRIDMDRVHAQLARQVMDMWLGFHISPLLWTYFQHHLSAGRCQTPALRLVYDNAVAHQAQQVTVHHEIIAHFTSRRLPFELNTTFQDEHGVKAFLAACYNFEHKWHCNQPSKIQEKSAPLPFSTSTLQQAASNQFRMTPKETMQVCQHLYEAGLITYMRTDSQSFAHDFLLQAHKYLTTQYPVADVEPYAPATEQKAHEAIRPTDLTRTPENVAAELDPRQLKMYKLIYHRALQSCMKPARFETRKIIISAPQVKKVHTKDGIHFAYTVQRVRQKGWLWIDVKNAATELPDETLWPFVQAMKAEQIIRPSAIESKPSVRGVVGHYTESRLVQLLESHGIGRPSTFASLVEVLFDRKYVVKQDIPDVVVSTTAWSLDDTDGSVRSQQQELSVGKEHNKIVITDLGRMVIEFLVQHFDALFKYDFTAALENDLDIVSKGDKAWTVLCEGFKENVNTLLTAFQAQAPRNIRKDGVPIDADHTYVVAKYGPVIRYVDPDNKKSVSYKPVIANVDLVKLQLGGYRVEDLIDKSKVAQFLGEDEASKSELWLHHGKFGYFLKQCYLDETKEPNTVNVTAGDAATMTFEQALQRFTTPVESNILETLDAHASVRKGPYGTYVYYQTPRMKKPRFFKNVEQYAKFLTSIKG
jgi:DNA topoisomerase-1